MNLNVLPAIPATGPLFSPHAPNSCPWTVFDPLSIELDVGGQKFSFADIEYLRVTREIAGLPVKGIITARLNAKIHTDTPFPPGAEIHLYDGFHNELLPVFYLSKPGLADGAAEITAYDNCRALDRIFDTTAFFSEEKDYPVSDVVSAAASQCGFGGAVNFQTAVSKIPYKFLLNKSCRSIFELLSQAACGVWFCNNVNQLEFKRFGDVTDYCTLDDSNCSDFRRGPVKGPISALQVYNPITDENYELGYFSGFIDKLKVSGKLVDRSAAEDILQNVQEKEYRAFSCKKAETTVIPNALCGFVYKGVMYRASSAVTDITPAGFFSTLRSPVIAEDRFDYVGTLEYSIADRILQEKNYGSSVMSFSGLRFVNDSDSFGFTVKDKGVTVYDGNEISKNTAADITVSDDVSSVTYSVKGITKTALSLVWEGDVLKSYSRKITDTDGNVIHDDSEEDSTNE